MIPAKFDYQQVDTAEGAIAALTEHGDEAKLLAGGHSLIPLMKFRLAVPTVLIDIGHITELSYVNDRGDFVAIGALTTHRTVQDSELLRQHAPLLAHVASKVGDPSVRNRGTLGGSLAHADPASDLPAAALALGATFVARGPNGDREIAASDFFESFLETVLEPNEILTEIRIPKHTGAGWSYQKFNRRAQDWAIVGAAVQLGDTPRVALVNMDSKPIRAAGVEQALASGASAADAASVAADGTSPSSDLNGDADYRNHLARVLVERGIVEAHG